MFILPPTPQLSPATIRVNGKYVEGHWEGRRTPHIRLPVGDHEIRVEAEGYGPWSDTVHVHGGDRVQLVAVRLRPISPTATAISEVTDAVDNLRGDPERSDLAIVSAAVRGTDDVVVFSVDVAAPFPHIGDLRGGRRLDFIWLVDIDRDMETGQSAPGNDHNLHVYRNERGWHPSFYKSSDVARADGIDIDLTQVGIRVRGRRVELRVPRDDLPSDDFDWWVRSMTGNSDDWGPLTRNPKTRRVTFLHAR